MKGEGGKRNLTLFLTLLILASFVHIPANTCVEYDLYITNDGNSGDYPNVIVAGQNYSIKVRWYQNYDTDPTLCYLYINGILTPYSPMGGKYSAGYHQFTWTLTAPANECSLNIRVYLGGVPVGYDDWNFPPGTYDNHYFTISVEKANKAPTAERAKPSSSTVNVDYGDSVTFGARGEDVDGNRKGIKWYVDGALEADHSMAGCAAVAYDEYVHKFDKTGTHKVEAVVYDSEGLCSNKVAWTVNVNSDGKIKAYVKDDKGNAVYDAEIFLDGASKGRTDKYGYMTINGVAVGSHTIKAERSGYLDDSKTVTISPGEAENVTLTLRPEEDETPGPTKTEAPSPSTSTPPPSSTPAPGEGPESECHVMVVVKDSFNVCVEGATVYLISEDDNVYTNRYNSNGLYYFEVPAGRFRIIATKQGYQSNEAANVTRAFEDGSGLGDNIIYLYLENDMTGLTYMCTGYNDGSGIYVHFHYDSIEEAPYIVLLMKGLHLAQLFFASFISGEGPLYIINSIIGIVQLMDFDVTLFEEIITDEIDITYKGTDTNPSIGFVYWCRPETKIALSMTPLMISIKDIPIPCCWDISDVDDSDILYNNYDALVYNIAEGYDSILSKANTICQLRNAVIDAVFG